MSDQKEEMSDLKNAGKNRGKKGSLKSVREKIVYMNPWGLWSDPCGGAQWWGPEIDDFPHTKK